MSSPRGEISGLVVAQLLQQRGLVRLVGGWQIAGTIRFSTGVPINIRAPNTLGSFGYGVKRSNVSGDPNLSNPTPERWFNTDVFTAPGRFEQGTAPRHMNELRQDGIADANISLRKRFQIVERMLAQLRAEFFNLTNSPVFGVPIGGGVGYGDQRCVRTSRSNSGSTKAGSNGAKAGFLAAYAAGRRWSRAASARSERGSHV